MPRLRLPGRSAQQSEPTLSPAERRAIERSRRLATLVDAQWRVGPFRFGIETLVDFIPVLGDAPSLALSLYQLAVARRLGVPRSVRVRMGINIGIDTLVGGVPVLGDLVDTLFKVHLRNQRLIDAYLQRTRSG